MIDHDFALHLQQSGRSAAQMAAALGVTKRTVERWRQRNHLSQPWHGVVAVPAEVLERARLLLEDGASCAEAARSVGVDWKTLRRHFPDMKWSTAESISFASLIRRAA